MARPRSAARSRPAKSRTTTARQKSRAYHKGNVSHDLLAAAARILRTERVEDISVRRLAREVGVTPANFYNHFESLDLLLQTLAADGFDRLTASTARSIAKGKDKRDTLLEICGEFVEFAMANKQLFRIMFGQFPNATVHERFKEASDTSFGQLIRFVYGRDIYDPTRLAFSHERGRAAYALFALAYGLARSIIDEQFQFESGTRVEIRHFVDDVVATIFDGTLANELSAA